MRTTVAALVRKDLRLELRAFESLPAMLMFSVSTFVLFHFGLDRGQEAEQHRRLGHEQRGAVDRRQQEAVEAALLALGHEQARDAEHGREQQRHPQHPGRQLALDRAAVEREVEEHERAEAEQQHRGHRLAGPQLDPQVLAHEGADRAPHR